MTLERASYTAGPPDVAARTVYASNRRKIVTALAGAFAIRVLANLEANKKTNRYDAQNVIDAVSGANIPAWVVIAAVLMMASDFESTSRPAMAFALLIFIGLLIGDGEMAIKTINRIVNPPKPKAKKKGK